MTYSANGSDFLINKPSAQSQYVAAVVSLQDDQFAVKYYDRIPLTYKIDQRLIRVFDGATGGDEIKIPATGFASAALSDGRVIANVELQSTDRVTVQFYTSSLTASLTPVVVYQNKAGSSDEISSTFLEPLKAGGFVQAWLSSSPTTTKLYAQTFDNTGKATHAAALLDATAYDKTLGVLADGRLAMFAAQTQTVTLFSADLSKKVVTSEVDTVSTNPMDLQSSHVVGLSNGGFVVVWSEGILASLTPPTIHAQVFDSAGKAVTEDIVIDVPKATGAYDVAALASGDFAIVLDRSDPYAPAGTTPLPIAIKTFSATGDELGFTQYVAASGYESSPQIAALSGGGFVTVWQNGNAASGLDEIRGQIFASNMGRTIIGTAGPDKLTGTAKDDTLSGLGGNDRLAGLGGRDTASYAAAAAGVQVALALTTAQKTGGAGTDTLTGIEDLIGSRFNDALTGDARRNVLTGLAGADQLHGGAGGDRLVGGAGADVLIGGPGFDVMIGGTGRDTYYVDNVGDQVIESRAKSAAGTSLGGTDTVISTVSFILPDFVEVLKLAAGDSYIDGTGNGGSNTIIGNDGKNVLDGAGGNDRLTGGADNDLFKLNAAGSGVTVLTDFDSGTDIIGIRNPFGSELAFGTAATTAEQRLIYDIGTGNIYYDADGSGSQAQVLLAVLASKPEIFGYDFMEI